LIIDFAIWFFKYYLPVMVANASPLLIKGSKPIDFSKRFIDGKPILGPHKTWEGLIIALYMGLSTSLAISIVLQDPLITAIGFGGSVFAVLGDLVGSFIKRRLGYKSGEPVPVLDQLDFAITSSIFYMLVDVSFIEKAVYIPIALVIIAILHVSTNIVAYMIGLKKTKF